MVFQKVLKDFSKKPIGLFRKRQIENHNKEKPDKKNIAPEPSTISYNALPN